jgi:poly(A) polymerase
VKFATRLDFEIDERTWRAMRTLSDHLERAASPRVLEEILRLMRSGTALGAFKMLRACGALQVVLPAVDAFLGPRRGGGEEVQRRAEGFWRLLEALDSEVHQGYEPSTAVCIAVLFERIVQREVDSRWGGEEEEGVDLAAATWDVLEPVAIESRLSRRDFGRARRILTNQSRFSAAPSNRFSPLLFALTEDFAESLELFGLRVEARGKGWDIYQAWQNRLERARRAAPEEIEAERRRTRTGSRRRGRRRRGRRRRRGGADGPDGDGED